MELLFRTVPITYRSTELKPNDCLEIMVDNRIYGSMLVADSNS